MKTLGNALKGLVGSITESAVAKNAAQWSLRFFEGVGKMVGGGATGGALTVALGVYDAYEGANNAATLFRVKPEDVSFKMTMVAMVFNVLMHFPLYIWIIDLMLEIAYYVSGGEIDVKPILLKMICDAIGLEDNVGELQAKYKKEYAEFAKRIKETEGENADVSMDRYNETLDNSYTPVADWIRQNVPGGTLLTGKNAADGTFRHGLMSGVGRAVEENPWYMNLIPGVPLIQGAKNFLIGDTTEDGREEKGILSDVQVFGKTVNQRIDEIFGDNGTFTTFINNTKSTIDEKYEAVFGEEGSFTKFYNGLKSDFDIKYDELLGENGTITKAWDEFSRDGGTFDTFTTELGKDMVAGWEWLFGVKDEKGNTIKGNIFERVYDTVDHFFYGDKNSDDEYLRGSLGQRIQMSIEQGANDIETWFAGSYNEETKKWEKLPLKDRLMIDFSALMYGGPRTDGTINEKGILTSLNEIGTSITAEGRNTLAYIFGESDRNGYQGMDSGLIKDIYAGIDNNMNYLFGPVNPSTGMRDSETEGVINATLNKKAREFRETLVYIL